MIDPESRAMMDRLRDLRSVKPSASDSERAVADVRRRMRVRVRRQIIGWSAAVTSAAAAILLILFLSSSKPHIAAVSPVQPTPANELKQPVESSNQYKGLIQVEISNQKLAASGQTALDPTVRLVELDTSAGIANLPSRLTAPAIGSATSPGSVVRFNGPTTTLFVPSTSRVRNILIPITWEGVRVIPIPLGSNDVTVRPLQLPPQAQVSRSSDGTFSVYHVAPVVSDEKPDFALDLRSAPQGGTVWVDPKTGLVHRIELLSRDRNEQLEKQQMIYRYLREPASSLVTPVTRP